MIYNLGNTMQSKDKILVVGGYGQVGRVICKDLGNKFPGNVVAVGRNYDKAEQFTRTTNGKVIPLEFDVFADNNNNNILEEISVVVMCLDLNDTRFIEQCIDKGIHYVDISASYSFLSKIMSLDEKAKASGSTIILSVGLSPGLTNLLVQYSKTQFDVLHRSDIFVLLGLGEEHGKAAIEWMVDNMHTTFEVSENGYKKQVKSLEDGKATLFSENFGNRIAYRFNFAEQHFLPVTLDIKRVSHRICFDSRLVTQSLAAFRKLGILNLLKLKPLRNAAVKMFENIQFGSDAYVIKVDSSGKKDDKITEFKCSVIGRNQSEATGKVAAVITESIYIKKHPSGVYHIEQIFNSSDIIDRLSEHIKFHTYDK